MASCLWKISCGRSFAGCVEDSVLTEAFVDCAQSKNLRKLLAYIRENTFCADAAKAFRLNWTLTLSRPCV